MSRRVFIVHGWGGNPEEGWFPWLKRELEKEEIVVDVPEMPDTEEPKMEAWISHLAQIVGDVDDQTYFVGHSIGCQTILRYLERLPSEKKVGGAVLVAPWMTLMNQSPEEIEIAKPWIETQIDFEKVKTHTQKFIAIFSDNDDCVPIENKKFFEERVGTKSVVEHNKGHFSGGDGITELPSVFAALKEMMYD